MSMNCTSLYRCGAVGRGLFYGTNLRICLEEPRKTTTHFSVSRPPDRDSILEYKSAALPLSQPAH